MQDSIAEGLAGAGLVLNKKHLLELAARFASRWPSLSAVSEAAHLPLLAAIRGFFQSDVSAFFEHGAEALAVFDPEIEGVAAGIRRACLKENIPAIDAALLVRAYNAMGLYSAEVETCSTCNPAFQRRHGFAHKTVAAANDPGALLETVTLQTRINRKKGDVRDLKAVGTLMGYPDCCIEASTMLHYFGNNVENERRPFLREPSHPLHPLIHRLGRVRLISHHLCTPDCPASVSKAYSMLSIMKAVDVRAASWIENELSYPVLFIDYHRRSRLSGRWSDDRFIVETMVPIGIRKWMGVRPDRIKSIRVDRLWVQFETKTGSTRKLSAEAPLLTSPGVPLAPAALRAIATASPSGIQLPKILPQ